MDTHRVETTLEQDGTLTLRDLPFQAGETVEVIILPKAVHSDATSYALRGTLVGYTDPFNPVAAEEWEAGR